MSTANQAAQQLFVGNGIQTAFAFVIDYFDNEAEDVFEVYVAGVLKTYTTHYTITEGAPNADGICTGGTINFVAAPANLAEIKIVRVTPRVQDGSFSGVQFPAASVESRFDRIVMMIQELFLAISQKIGMAVGSGLSGITLPLESAFKYIKWNSDASDLTSDYGIPIYTSGEDYPVGVYVDYNNAIYRCTSAHTAGVTLDINKFVAISGPAGAQGNPGPTGPQGATGATGATGAAGANGAPGADGIFSAIASQAEAQAGTDNTKGMTPLRTAQAIAAQVPNLGVITTLQSDVDAVESDIADHNSRLLVLESAIPITQAVGRQRINNNVGLGSEVLLQGAGLPGEAGLGNALELDESGAFSARVHVEIKRKTDLETRFVTSVLLLQCVDGVWYLERESTTPIIGNLDGVLFSIDQSGDVGRVQYSSDNMAGVYNVAESYCAWKILEIMRLA